ncbi:MAG: hypothetical protein J6R77_04785 [Clostridia bacterium]|nr:hypothetical protein [Clostridia bacterium]
MRKRLSWGAVLSLLIIVVAVTVCVTMLVAMRRFNAQVNELSNRQSMYNYISDVDNAVRQHYYGTIDEEVLRRAIASGQVKGLGDKYAKYFTTEQYSAWLEQMSGQSTGFGLEIALDEKGQVVLSAVQQGSTAYSAGLQKGDVVTALNKASLGEDPLATLQAALDANQPLILTIRRDGQETAFELSASAYTRVSVDSSLIETTGLIRIKAITDATPDQLKAAYSSLKEKGATELVLDLRGVEAGSPEAAKRILSFLLPYGLYGYYTDGDKTTELRAEESTQLDVPTAVLVNKKTAGEAELIAAALKQAGKAQLVGNGTAGRSLVQDCYSLASDNAAVYITVGEFLLLNKSGWEGQGLTPDVEASLTEEQEKVWELILPEYDPQFQAAVGALKGTTTTEPTTTTTTEVTTTTTVAEGETTTAEGETTTTAS